MKCPVTGHYYVVLGKVVLSFALFKSKRDGICSFSFKISGRLRLYARQDKINRLLLARLYPVKRAFLTSAIE